MVTSAARAFAIAAAVLLLFVLLFKSKVISTSIDISVHDTYFVFSATSVCLLMATFLSLFAAVYAIVPTNPRVTSWHLWVTMGGIIAFWISFSLWARMLMQPHSTGATGTTLAIAAGLAFVLSVLVLLISPAIFVVNIVLALANHQTQTP